MAEGETNGTSRVAIARLEEQMADLKKDVAANFADLVQRIDGPPWERSLRGRMHTLESEAQSSKAVHAALEEMKKERQQGFSRNQKLVGTLVGVMAFGLQLLTVLSVIHK